MIAMKTVTPHNPIHPIDPTKPMPYEEAMQPSRPSKSRRSPPRAPGRVLGVLAASFLWLSAAGAQDSGAGSAADAAPAPSTMLRLKSGQIAFGEILAHDSEGIRFRMLETGGEIPIPWNVLDPTEADEMRLRYGYVETEAEELMTDADRIELANGGELIGRIVNRSESFNR